MTLLCLQQVAYRPRLQPFTAHVELGQRIHLVGPNGAGKSTLLMRMAGLTSGEGKVMFNGLPLSEWSPRTLARHRAVLIQQQTPPFSMPVWQYLLLHQSAAESEVVMVQVAAILQLDDKLTRQCSQLSGGEWQRVRLAALFLQVHPALNPDGQLLLLDEPVTGLDVAQLARLDTLLQTFSEAGLAIVMSSHDLNHTLHHASHVWLLRDGVRLASGACSTVLTPDHLQQAYGIPFRLFETEGRRILVSTPDITQNLL